MDGGAASIVPGTRASTNSLLVPQDLSSNVATTLASCATSSSSNGVFQTVGAGGHLPRCRHDPPRRRNQAIDSTLAAQLEDLTTYPPIVIETVMIEADTSLASRAGRDIDVPDLSYH
jgi:hypothetical protein